MKKSSIGPYNDYLKRLEEWGLTEDDAKQLGFKLLLKGKFEAVESEADLIAQIKIPYHDLKGEAVAELGYGDMARFRQIYSKGSFGQDVSDTRAKYIQPPDTYPHIYIPRIGDTDWLGIAMDITLPLIITEGEAKAAKGTKEGYPTIALGGVWSFKSNLQGLPFLKELEEFEWAQRFVYICYDSDVAEKDDVCMALNELANQLYQRGARVKIVQLPGTDDHKIGMDDFLVAEGAAAFGALLTEAHPLMAVEPLYLMNERYAYVNELNALYDVRNDNIIPAIAITNMFAHVPYYHAIWDGLATKLKPAHIGQTWMSWPCRRTVQKLTYKPGEDQWLEEDGLQVANIWSGWRTSPKKGSVKPFVGFIDFLFSDCTKEERKWLIQWIAYPIQHPGAKLEQAIVLHGPQGTGKTMLGKLLGGIYGKNFTVIEQAHLQSDFNGFMHGKQLILGDEISGTGSAEHRRIADKLKHYITGTEISVNRKNREPYDIPNCCNFIFTSNAADAFFLENDDRRYFIAEVPCGPMDLSWYDEIGDWRYAGGIEALHYYLLNLDLAGYNPKGSAPGTEAKVRMIHSSKSDLGAWVLDHVNAQDLALGTVPIKGDLFTAAELLAWYCGENPDAKPPSVQAMSKTLKENGATRVNGGKTVRTSEGQVRLWAIRNGDKWSNTSINVIAGHYEKHGARSQTFKIISAKEPK